MKIDGKGSAAVVSTLMLAVLASACGQAETAAEAPSSPASPSRGEPRPPRPAPPIDTSEPALSPRSPSLIEDDRAPVAEDLGRLVEAFVGYAIGESSSFPHADSVSMSLGGEPMVSIDDFAAALSTRRIWRVCPDHAIGYGASSCPVDLLGPILSAGVNGVPLVYTEEYGDVVCAPSRTGPLPVGRLVVLRPTRSWRTCATDFALVLAADDRGRLRSIDLTLSEP